MAGLMDRIPSSLLIFKISPSEALHLFYGSKICTDLHYKQTGLYLYGDFEQWIVRCIQESPIIGGQCKTIYAIGKQTLSGTIFHTSTLFRTMCGVMF